LGNRGKSGRNQDRQVEKARGDQDLRITEPAQARVSGCAGRRRWCARLGRYSHPRRSGFRLPRTGRTGADSVGLASPVPVFLEFVNYYISIVCTITWVRSVISRLGEANVQGDWIAIESSLLHRQDTTAVCGWRREVLNIQQKLRCDYVSVGIAVFLLKRASLKP
jgi:hypothetical protein